MFTASLAILLILCNYFLFSYLFLETWSRRDTQTATICSENKNILKFYKYFFFITNIIFNELIIIYVCRCISYNVCVYYVIYTIFFNVDSSANSRCVYVHLSFKILAFNIIRIMFQKRALYFGSSEV